MQEGIFVDLNSYYLVAIIWITFLVSFVLWQIAANAYRRPAHISRSSLVYPAPPLWVWKEEPTPEAMPAPAAEEPVKEAAPAIDDGCFYVVLSDASGVHYELRLSMLLDEEGNEIHDPKKAHTALAHHEILGWVDIAVKNLTWENHTLH